MNKQSNTIAVSARPPLAYQPPYEVDPDAVLVNAEIKALRAWNGMSEQEAGIAELARMILEEGQQVPCIVYETAAGLVMVDGERRRAAVNLIRATEEGMADYPLKIHISDLTDDGAIRVALITTIQRAGFTGMELAHNITFIRARFGWEGPTGSAQVADFLGVSPATVTQAEKLLLLPQHVQDDVQAGRTSTTAALEITTTPAAIRPAVSARAQELANTDAAAKRKAATKPVRVKSAPLSDAVKGKGKDKRRRVEAASAPTVTAVLASPVIAATAAADEALCEFCDTSGKICNLCAESPLGCNCTDDVISEYEQEHGDATQYGPCVACQGGAVDAAESLDDVRNYAKLAPLTYDANGDVVLPDEQTEIEDEAVPASPARVETRHVRQAQREIPGAMPTPKAPKIGEAITLIEQWQSKAAYPAVMVQWAERFVEWAHGKCTDAVLSGAWDLIAAEITNAQMAEQEALDTANIMSVVLTAVPTEEGAAQAAPPAPTTQPASGPPVSAKVIAAAKAAVKKADAQAKSVKTAATVAVKLTPKKAAVTKTVAPTKVAPTAKKSAPKPTPKAKGKR